MNIIHAVAMGALVVVSMLLSYQHGQLAGQRKAIDTLNRNEVTQRQAIDTLNRYEGLVTEWQQLEGTCADQRDEAIAMLKKVTR